MNKHSIKVPRLYKVSALVAKEVSEGIGSIKSLVYEHKKKHPNIKAIYALVATLFQKTDEIETLLKRSQLLVKEPKLNPWLAKILIIELLWGKKKLPGQSKPEDTIRAYEQIFKAHLSDDSGKETISKDSESKPRYVRINTILSSLNEAIETFRDDGWTLVKFLDKTDYKGYLERIVSLNNDEFLVDIHVPNLLVFPSKTTFYNHPAYKNGSILLQDKASCLPVHILDPPPGSTVLDMCAAPGMKTTHLAAVMNNQGTVYAIERNPKRFETLSKIVETSGAKCVKTYNKDILDCFNEAFPGVEYILVDPSCSGTGMVDRPEDNEIDQSRLRSLTGFQIKILRHALTKFPDAKKVVYSTCSVLPEENEDVVRQVLETNYNFKLVPAKQFVGESWQNVGSSEFGDIGKNCLYAKPNEDYTNGFFVAVFERLKEGEENQFFNTKIFNFKKHVQANERWKEKKQKKFDDQNHNGKLDEENTDSSKNKHKYTNDNTKTDISSTTDVKEEEMEGITNRKKKKKKSNENIQETPTNLEEEYLENVSKRAKYDHEDDTNNLKGSRVLNNEKDENDGYVQDIKIEDDSNKKKSKKKKRSKENIDEDNHTNNKEEFTENNGFEESSKKKKRKHKKSHEVDNVEDVKNVKNEIKNSTDLIKTEEMKEKYKNIEELIGGYAQEIKIEDDNNKKKSKKKKKSKENIDEDNHANKSNNDKEEFMENNGFEESSKKKTRKHEKSDEADDVKDVKEVNNEIKNSTGYIKTEETKEKRKNIEELIESNINVDKKSKKKKGKVTEEPGEEEQINNLEKHERYQDEPDVKKKKKKLKNAHLDDIIVDQSDTIELFCSKKKKKKKRETENI